MSKGAVKMQHVAVRTEMATAERARAHVSASITRRAS